MEIDVSTPKTWKTALSVMIVVLILLSTTSAAFAAFRVINLNDNAVDTQWANANPVYTSTCSNGSLDNRNEIKNAWITNSDPAGANGGWYYFRVETCAEPALLTTDYNVAVQFDCNNDGDFTDPAGGPPNYGDRKVLYTTNGTSIDWTRYLSGTNANLRSGNDPWDLPCASNIYLGERVTGSSANVEWGYPFCDMPPGCRGADTPPIPIHFQFGIANVINGTTVDGTPVLNYSSPPTAVTLNSLSANSPAWQNPALLFAVSTAAALLAAGLFFLRRRLSTET